MPDEKGKQSGPGVKDTPDQAYKSGRSEDVQEGSLGVDTGGAGTQKSRLPEGRDEPGTAHSGGFAGQQADDSPDAGTVDSASGEGDPSPQEGESSATPHASADDVKRMEDAPDQQNAAPGAAVDQQGFGQHGDQDVTEVEDKQEHPKTPSDMGSR